MGVYVVDTTEHHWLPTCPCRACEAERSRSDKTLQFILPDNHVRSLSVEAAHILGFIKRRCPDGSLARELMRQAGDSQ